MAFANYFQFVALKERLCLMAKPLSQGVGLKKMADQKLLETVYGYVLGVCSVQRKSLAAINLREKKGSFLKQVIIRKEKRENGEKLQHVLIVTRKLYKHNLHTYQL